MVLIRIMKEKIKEYRQRVQVSYFWNFALTFVINLLVKEIFDYFWETDNTFLDNVIQSIILAVVLSWIFVNANRNTRKKESEF